jgi:hypothetical protein
VTRKVAGTESLSSVRWIADAHATKITSESRVKLGDAFLAMGTMHPGSFAAEMPLVRSRASTRSWEQGLFASA